MADPVVYGKDSNPQVAEWGLRRAYLARMGVPESQVVLLIGRNPNQFTRLQSSENIRAYCATLRKK